MNNYITIVIGVIFIAVGYCIKAPRNATAGYHLASLLLPMVSYAAILALVAWVIAAIARRTRQWWFPIFAGLFVLAGMVDLLAAVARTHVTAQVEDTLSRMEQREGRPAGEILDQKLAESRQVISTIDSRGLRQQIERTEGKRLEQIPVSRLKTYLGGF